MTAAVVSSFLVLCPIPSSAGASDPVLIDPAGDANVVDGAAPGIAPGSPASVGWADITKVWFTTDYREVPATRDGVRGMLRVPQRLRVHIQTAAPVSPVGAGIVYGVEGEVNNCTYRFIAHVPGAWRDSRKAMLSALCGPSGVPVDLQPPVVSGNEVQIAVDLGSDADLRLYDGSSLSRIRAFTAPYADFYWDYRSTGDTAGYIDYAPSSGDLGYYEIGSDLAPRFTPGLSFDPGTVTTVAGGASGDGLPATEASLANPWGVSVGPDGLVYISDYSHARIRRIGADGRMEPVAGHVWGFAGDGGPALRALLDGPGGMDWGPNGTLYVADSLNHRVRAIAPDGTIRTIAGNGARRFAGDGGPATKASLAWPQSVAVAPGGDVFIADLENGRVRRVDASNGTISTYAGGAPAEAGSAVGKAATDLVLSPYGVAIDPQGDLWVSDVDRVIEIDHATGTVSTVVTGFDWAYGIDVDPAGNLYVADSGAGTIVRRSAQGVVDVIAGGGGADPGDGGPATDASFDVPMDVDVDGEGNVFVAERNDIGNYVNGDVGHDRVRVIHPDGTIDTIAGTGFDKASGTHAPDGRDVDFMDATAVAADAQGRLYIADSFAPGVAYPKARKIGGRLWRLDLDGSIRLVAGNGDITDDGRLSGPALDMPLGRPRAMDIGPDGRVWIADGANRRIKVYDPAAGTVSVAAGKLSDALDGSKQPDQVPALDAGLYPVTALAVAPSGDVYWIESSYGSGCSVSRIRRLHDGMVQFVGGSRSASSGCGFAGDGQPISEATRFDEPAGLDFDADGDLLVADSYNGRIRKIDAATGVVSTVAGDGALEHRDGTIAELSSLSFPIDVQAVPSGGFLVAEAGIADLGIRDLTTGPRISYVSPSGMVSTVAGNGVFDIAADDAALASSFVDLNSIALMPQGSLAVADYYRVRVLTPDEGGWPDPPREVRCLPMATDTAGDARSRETLELHTMNNPALDIRSVDVSTSGGTLTATIHVEDLEPANVLVPDSYEADSKAWVYLFSDGQGQYLRYLAAIGPFNHDEPGAAGQYSFEWGETTGGTFESLTFTRRGAATGSVDTAKETVTINAPLTTVGLSQGERVVFQAPLTGPLLDYDLSKFSVYSDLSPSTMWWRSYVVGRGCPDGYR